MTPKEELKRELIKKHLEGWHGFKQASIKHFEEKGKASGSFFMALKEMMEEYHKEQLALHGVNVKAKVVNIETNIDGCTCETGVCFLKHEY